MRGGGLATLWPPERSAARRRATLPERELVISILHANSPHPTERAQVLFETDNQGIRVGGSCLARPRLATDRFVQGRYQCRLTGSCMCVTRVCSRRCSWCGAERIGPEATDPRRTTKGTNQCTDVTNGSMGTGYRHASLAVERRRRGYLWPPTPLPRHEGRDDAARPPPRGWREPTPRVPHAPPPRVPPPATSCHGSIMAKRVVALGTTAPGRPIPPPYPRTSRRPPRRRVLMALCIA